MASVAAGSAILALGFGNLAYEASHPSPADKAACYQAIGNRVIFKSTIPNACGTFEANFPDTADTAYGITAQQFEVIANGLYPLDADAVEAGEIITALASVLFTLGAYRSYGILSRGHTARKSHSEQA